MTSRLKRVSGGCLDFDLYLNQVPDFFGGEFIINILKNRKQLGRSHFESIFFIKGEKVSALKKLFCGNYIAYSARACHPWQTTNAVIFLLQ